MKKLLILLFTMTIPCWGLEVSKTQIETLPGQNIVFPKKWQKETLSKHPELKKYLKKEWLIKEASLDKEEVLTIILQQIDKPSNEQTLSFPKQTLSFTKEKREVYKIPGAGLPRQLEKAQAFFVGKTLYDDPLSDQGFYHSNVMSGLLRPHNEQKFIIESVEWGSDDPYLPYKLNCNKNDYILTGKVDEMPTGFVDDRNGVFPEKYSIYEKDDRLEKSYYAESKNQLLTKSSFDILALNFYIYKGQKYKNTGIKISYRSNSWLFMNNATLFVDGEKIKLPIGDVSRDVMNEGIMETASATANKQILQKIINGKDVVLRISGDKGYVDGTFLPQNLYVLKRFYDEKIK